MTSRDGGRSHFLSGSFLTVTLTDCGPDESAAITAVATASQSESSSAVSVRKREELPCESLHGELDYCQLSGKLFLFVPLLLVRHLPLTCGAAACVHTPQAGDQIGGQTLFLLTCHFFVKLKWQLCEGEPAVGYLWCRW